MSSTQTIASILVGACMITPAFAFAEETAVTDPATGAPVPTLYQQPPREPAMMRAKAATGTRMMASTTRPIPKEVQDRIKTREEQMEKLRQNCTLPDGSVASRTDCQTFRAERREEVRERVVERRGEALRALTNVMIKRLDAAVERQVKLTDRIDARIAKLEAQGVVVTTAKEKVALARTKIAEAKTAIAATKTHIEAAVSSVNEATTTIAVKEAGNTVRAEMLKAREALLAAHKALVDAITSLKANIKAAPATPAASTTAQ